MKLANVEVAYACHPDIDDGTLHAHRAIEYANAALKELDELNNLIEYASAISLRDHLVEVMAEEEKGSHSS